MHIAPELLDVNKLSAIELAGNMAAIGAYVKRLSGA
jgi:hypothetical protein